MSLTSQDLSRLEISIKKLLESVLKTNKTLNFQDILSLKPRTLSINTRIFFISLWHLPIIAVLFYNF